MKISRLYLLLSLIISGCVYCYGQKIPRVPYGIKMPSENDKTMDEAYSAPTSMFVGTWIREQTPKTRLILKKDGTFEINTMTEYEINYIPLGFTFKGTWSKKNNDLNMRSNGAGASIFYDKQSIEGYSERKKSEFNEALKTYTTRAKSVKKIPINSSYIVYISDKFMGLASPTSIMGQSYYYVSWYVKEDYINEYLKKLEEEKK